MKKQIIILLLTITTIFSSCDLAEESKPYAEFKNVNNFIVDFYSGGKLVKSWKTKTLRRGDLGYILVDSSGNYVEVVGDIVVTNKK